MKLSDLKPNDLVRFNFKDPHNSSSWYSKEELDNFHSHINCNIEARVYRLVPGAIILYNVKSETGEYSGCWAIPTVCINKKSIEKL